MKFRVYVTSKHHLIRLLSITNSLFLKTDQLYTAVIIYQDSVAADRKDMLGRGWMLIHFSGASNNSCTGLTASHHPGLIGLEVLSPIASRSACVI